jgi:hypothetical protein
MDDSNLADIARAAGLEVRRNQFPQVTRSKRVQVQLAGDGKGDRREFGLRLGLVHA